MEEKLIAVGSKERIIFKNILKEKVVARVDTGAKTSSVHCIRHWFVKKEGVRYLHYIVVNEKAKVQSTTHYKKRKVKSSNGQVQTRYSVFMDVLIGGMTFNTEFTLTDRSHMKHKVLLGRSFLLNRFVVDVSKTYVLK